MNYQTDLSKRAITSIHVKNEDFRNQKDDRQK
jgi:hypothetical protein